MNTYFPDTTLKDLADLQNRVSDNAYLSPLFKNLPAGSGNPLGANAVVAREGIFAVQAQAGSLLSASNLSDEHTWRRTHSILANRSFTIRPSFSIRAPSMSFRAAIPIRRWPRSISIQRWIRWMPLRPAIFACCPWQPGPLSILANRMHPVCCRQVRSDRILPIRPASKWHPPSGP